ncbi:MAG: DUF368 domain-containing protein [Cytophagales bacterium]|nr:DUF368 domain-containing protein [Cytophagales bacterium]
MSKPFRHYLILAFKGMAMGAANVIPGVSGGTIAFITGIYETLIDSLKSFDMQAVKLLAGGKIARLSKHINLEFLLAVFIGIAISIISLAKLLEWLFENHPVLLWSFFFGLILASVFFVGKTIGKWSVGVFLMLVTGTAIAAGISLFNPAGENHNTVYLFICGIAAISSMIVPGLSGSFVLLLMGNYMLVLTSITELNMVVLIPFALGCVFGLLAFSHLLSYVFKHYKEGTIAILTGFILGSLSILWPWKNEIYLKDEYGNSILRHGEPLVQSYQWFIPDLSGATLVAVALMIIGVLTIWGIEKFAEQKNGY